MEKIELLQSVYQKSEAFSGLAEAGEHRRSHDDDTHSGSQQRRDPSGGNQPTDTDQPGSSRQPTLAASYNYPTYDRIPPAPQPEQPTKQQEQYLKQQLRQPESSRAILEEGNRVYLAREVRVRTAAVHLAPLGVSFWGFF